jgi:dipeptidyl aminopeptidase/acylaminoacyl peptidase
LNIPNYTGSTGFGDFYVQKLIGKCGTLDVEDVKATVDLLVKEGKGEYGPGKQLVTGGSHGGFLTAHRECHYPYSDPSFLCLTTHHACYNRVDAGRER